VGRGGRGRGPGSREEGGSREVKGWEEKREREGKMPGKKLCPLCPLSLIRARWRESKHFTLAFCAL
jgi:hypothetical protein